DRDGKYQLGMLAPSAFAPLARSAGPMLREEAFHLGTGQDGLKRIIQGNRVSVPTLQRYVNKWVSTALDLFGKDESSTAEWGYVWGLKGRFDEKKQADKTGFDRKDINDHNRNLYWDEVSAILNKLNGVIAETGREEKLIMPDIKFHRSIGRYADAKHTVDGQEFSGDDYDAYLKSVMPDEKVEQEIADIAKDNDWIADKKLPDDAWNIKAPVMR
ncbi:MAG: hypothetical protein KDB07_11885, partial [Planctomycetes bacterium]|nr:hypothetical protein [Planctomycetota bacterium]